MTKKDLLSDKKMSFKEIARRTLQYAKKERKKFIFAFFLIILNVIFDIVFPLLTMYLTNQLKLPKETVSLPNAISVKNDGLYAPDYAGAINKISGSNDAASERIHELETKLVEMQGALQKIVTNLYQAGNSTSNDINTFQINNHIACGNINLYGGKADGNTLIKTHNGSAENDVTIGAR